MLDFVLRAVGMYFMAMIMIRLLGKRALGELGPFDFVVMTGVGHTVVSIALDKSIPYYEGIIILATLAVLEYLMGFAALKSARLSDLITGKPVVLIDNGFILKENLKREKFNLDDLFQELRKKGIRDINQVEKGILESCGGFSVILKKDEEPVTCRDLGIKRDDSNDFLTIGANSRSDIFATNNVKREAQASFDLVTAIKDLDKKLTSIEERLQRLEIDRLKDSN